jgi:hypothetical protein
MFEFLAGLILGMFVFLIVTDARDDVMAAKCQKEHDVYKCEYVYVPVPPEHGK